MMLNQYTDRELREELDKREAGPRMFKRACAAIRGYTKRKIGNKETKISAEDAECIARNLCSALGMDELEFSKKVMKHQGQRHIAILDSRKAKPPLIGEITTEHFSSKVVTALKKNGVTTLEELLRQSDLDLLKMTSIGNVAVREIKKTLASRYGVEFPRFRPMNAAPKN